MQLVIAEKPSVARDLARLLGVRPSGRHAFEGREHVVTWCVGHLVELEEPAAYDPAWKSWRMDSLPMIPGAFRLRASAGTRDQFQAVRRLLGEVRFTEVVNACDAGREGELIFRYVYELAGSKLPIRRLWISSLTDEAIRGGFAGLRPGADFEALAAAARCRSEADWLVGLNATRAVTVRKRWEEGPAPAAAAAPARGRGRGGRRGRGGPPVYSIGRVQTPTLAIVVRRDQEIRAFVPRDYWEVRGRFRPGGLGPPERGEQGRTGGSSSSTDDEAGAAFTATWGLEQRPDGARRTPERLSRIGVRAVADGICARDAAHAAATDPEGPVVVSVSEKRTREPPPLLFDLTSLQRTANRRYGLSAARTLEAAQALYERHKILTYPRTDSRHLSHDLAAELPGALRALAELPEYAPFARPLLDAPLPRSKRVFDDTKVSDHHAIIPTGKRVNLEALERDQRLIFDLVARRFIGAFHPDAEFAQTEVVIGVGGGGAPAQVDSGPPMPGREVLVETLPPPPDIYVARGRVRLVAGWQVVAGMGETAGPGARGGRAGSDGDSNTEDAAEQRLPRLTEGQRLDGAFEAVAKQTRPPPRHTEATLLSAMEYAGRELDDSALRAAMKDTGLGTPATRAATIETLLQRGFIERAGKHLVATERGTALIQTLPAPELASPELTGTWEARLARIARGEETRAAFMADIAAHVKKIVEAIRRGGSGPVPATPPAAAGGAPTSAAPPRNKPARSSDAAPLEPAPVEPALGCPACKQGTLLAGRRGWGCSRWREGCGFVIWFELAGRRLTPANLRDLVEKGRTRKSTWSPAGTGSPDVAGRLVLDLAAPRERGAARFEAAEES